MGCGQSSNPKCYLDLAINGSVIGRLVVELRTDKVPKTAENFRALCTGENGNSYQGSTIHRIVPGFIAQVIHKWVHSHLARDRELHWSHVISMDFRKPDGNESEVEITTKFFPFSLCFWTTGRWMRKINLWEEVWRWEFQAFAQGQGCALYG